MLDSILIVGSLLFFCLLMYAFQLRQRKYKKYPTYCDVLYYPKKEEIRMIDPSEYDGKSYKFKTKANREIELANKDKTELITIARNKGYSPQIPENMDKTSIVNIILNMEKSELKDSISNLPENYPN